MFETGNFSIENVKRFIIRLIDKNRNDKKASKNSLVSLLNIIINKKLVSVYHNLCFMLYLMVTNRRITFELS